MSQVKERGGFGYKETHFRATLGVAVYRWNNSYIHTVFQLERARLLSTRASFYGLEVSSQKG